MAAELKVAIYGMGRFGRALAGALPEGVLVRAGGRSDAPAGLSVPYAKGVAEFTSGLQAGLVVLSVPDDALEDVAAEFAESPTAIRHDYVHVSGSRGLDSIAALDHSEIGSFHILQSFPPQGGEMLLPGSYVVITGDYKLQVALKELAARLDLHVIVQTDDFDPVAYHAGAVLASNALIALLDSARQLLEQAGIPPAQAFEMLIPLAGGTLSNVHSQGLLNALTGPVVRGDAGTIQKHLGVLSGDLRRTYISSMLNVCATAEQSGRVAAEKLAVIRTLLKDAEGG